MNAKKRRILVVSQSDVLDGSLIQDLEHEGYDVTVVSNIEEEREDLFLSGLPAGIILDLQGLENEGLKFCDDMVTYAGLAVVIIGSSQTQDIAYPAEALECADSYVRRSELYGEEVAARMRQILSRFSSFAHSMGREVQLTRDITVDFIAKTVQTGGKAITLTPTETALLNVLMVYQGLFVASETIIDRVWRGSDEGNANSLRVHMHRLRRKMGDTKRSGGIIETIRSTGYSLNP
jgi:DNA-binding response OmpR family regulator